MRSTSDTPLTREEQHAANVAMAARKETEDFKRSLTEDLRLKMWCIERGIEAMKSSPVWFNDDTKETRYYAEELSRKFFDFINE